MLPSQKCRVGGVGEGWEGVGATAPFSDQLTVLSEPQFFVFIQRQVAHPCLHRRQDMQHPARAPVYLWPNTYTRLIEGVIPSLTPPLLPHM